ncbi:hypothetical protein Poli38472_002272 [Pythium oligandrum]|uniref:UBX domain-containing protein n=1 Tax=Pythium oligandrum TaxID=41045 RepID=A0A8K1FI18_PYTOL|nr:hypothetical protein Poli38472_002272 [Pythium oligandrum]|eukprot:TMW63331.1 hypothetical protein Poli38472_002272 [Pythium oligandrum]
MAVNIEFNNQSKRIRVSPAMTMFQVVEAAREQFQLTDSAVQYELTHKNRPVDLSIPFRLTGISNNAALELKALASTGEVPQVRVCVQLTDGKRVQESFGYDSTLERILSAWKLFPAADEFSLTFLQREIPYDTFASTTLKDLGLVSGSAMFRMQRAGGNSAPAPAPRSVTFAPSTAPSAPTPSVPTPAASPTAPAPVVTESKPATTEFVAAPPAPAPTPAPVDVEMTPAEPQPSVPRMRSYDALQLLRDNSFDAVSRPAVTTLMKIVTNILSYPDNEKMRSIRVSNAAFDRNVGQHRGGIEFLVSVGFELDPETQMLVLTTVTDAVKSSLQNGLRLLNNEADDLNIDDGERPKVVVPMPVDASFDPFKPQITRMQMQPRGPSATEVLVDTLKAKQEEILEKAEKPPRNTKATLPGQVTAIPSAVVAAAADVETDQPTDAGLVIASMKARRVEMEKANNFRTQAMRELDELKRKRVFQTALIRVQFPDRVTLQAAFHPTETVADVISHVRECLDSEQSQRGFYLYVSPPLQKLAPEKTLSELSLVPAAHTYLSWTDEFPTPASAFSGWYLRSDLITSERAESKSSDGDVEMAYPKPIPLDEQAAANAAGKREAAAQAAAKRAGGEEKKSTGKKKPGWLKL